jgi:hypothetical protein
LAGQQRVHAVLDRGAQVHERRAVAEQITQVAQLRRGDVRLGQQTGAQQVRERLGVDRVCLHPGGGDRPGPQRVREVHVKAGVLEQLGEPFPAVGRLQRDMRSLWVAEQFGDRLASGRDPFGERQLSVLVNDRDLRAPSGFGTEADLLPRRGSRSSGSLRPRPFMTSSRPSAGSRISHEVIYQAIYQALSHLPPP